MNDGDVESLQAWLAVEHEAVWLYGVIGGRVDELTDAARDAWNRHRDNRDQLEAWIRAAGGEPVGPHMGYTPAAIDSARTARRAAQAVEAKVSAAAVGNLADSRHRAVAVTALRRAARAATEWGAAASAFPGLD
ncbi:MAG TPA: DUF4439 domain-containing protein [Aeromicrobium sp.]|nr:DUF4439 domain-containing protein [Aeromicrobium sp.]